MGLAPALVGVEDLPRHGGHRDAGEEAKTRLEEALVSADPAGAIAGMLNRFPIPERLSEIGFDRSKTDFVAAEVAAGKITAPRPVSADDVRALLSAAY